jgi:hypothetical protein
MRNKKPIALLICLALITSLVFIGITVKSGGQRAKDIPFVGLKNNVGPIFRGFKYSQYNENKRGVTITAAHFSIEKKKTGIFKLSPFKFARFRGAEIDLFGETNPPGQNIEQPPRPLINRESNHHRRNISSFKGLISKETIPLSALRGAVSAICEPVKINFYLNDAPVTRIKADKGIVDPRQRILVLENSIQVTSGSSHLTADRLKIYPETGRLEVDNYYVLKTSKGTRKGKKLTTDFYLNQIFIQ